MSAPRSTVVVPAPTESPPRGGVVPVVSALGIAAVGAYVGAQVISDVASVKVGIVADRAVDMGTFIYPITFTLRDMVHKTFGKRVARTLVVTAAVVNLFMAAYFRFAIGVESAEGGLGGEFALVLGPLWRIVIASIVAEVVSQLLDTEVYHWFVTRVTRRYQWARVLVSNSVSVPVDNLIFAVGAFAPLPLLADDPLTLAWADVWDIFLVNLVVKYLVTLVSLPLIYASPDGPGTSAPSADDEPVGANGPPDGGRT